MILSAYQRVRVRLPRMVTDRNATPYLKQLTMNVCYRISQQ